MGNLALRVDHISKKYRLGTKVGSYLTLREQIVDTVTAPFRNIFSQVCKWTHSNGATSDDLNVEMGKPANHEYIWAINDLSFEVQHGELVGIVGSNGAGKSTILKILSRITEPTKGRVEIRGRVGSLLEVGIGFHRELTGRENIYLNGAILGMKKAEVARRFDEIVAFAEVERFLDTAVKHYSSGMYLRLAFAVAAHLEPEILIVDEVLAVGDGRFQKKCLKKMEEVGQQGRTVLFVSHNMSAITRLCKRTILLDQGQLQADGPSNEVISAYLNVGLGLKAIRTWPDSPGSEIVQLHAIRVQNVDGQTIEAVDIRQSVGIEMVFDVLQAGHVLWPHYYVHNEEGVLVFVAIDHDPAWKKCPRRMGRYVSTGWIPGNFLSEGTMVISAVLATLDPDIVHFHEENAVAFQVIDTLEGGSVRGDYTKAIPGVVRPLLRWTTQFQPKS